MREWLKSMSTKWLILIIIILVLVIVGIVIRNPSTLFNDDCAKSKYGRLNPQIVCNEKPIVDKKNYIELKGKINDFTEKKKEAGEVAEVSLYFRDLQYGPTFGIDEYVPFSPASLLKLPLLITYLGLWESNPTLLETKVYYESSADANLTQSIVPKKSIQQDTPYTIHEVIEHMIKYSDNKSYYVLLEYLNQVSPDKQLLRETFVDLGIIDPRNEFEDTITVKSYAGIFTQLFNSTYFSNKETSEMTLDFLADTDFTQGLVAGVPPGITVAHKFGERYDEATQLKQLHDCGVVYYPRNPYLICIMTRGDSMPELMGVLAEISKMVYEEFDSRKLK